MDKRLEEIEDLEKARKYAEWLRRLGDGQYDADMIDRLVLRVESLSSIIRRQREALEGLITRVPIISTYHGLDADCPDGGKCKGHPQPEPEAVRKAREALSLTAKTPGEEGK